MYMQIGVRELRADLAQMVRRAGAGEEIVVTVGGRPLARLGPLGAAGGLTLDDLVATGAVHAPRTRRTATPEAVLVPADTNLDRALQAVR